MEILAEFDQLLTPPIGRISPRSTLFWELWHYCLDRQNPFVHCGLAYQDWLDRRRTLRFLRNSGMSESKIIPYFLRSLEVQGWI